MEKANGAIWREKIWFHKIGEEGINSSVKLIIPGIFVGHHDRTGAVLCFAESGIVRGKSRTKQALSDAWESMIREGLFGKPWHRRLHTAIAETKMTKKFITDEEGTDLPLRKIVQRLSVEDSTSCLLTLKPTDTWEVVRDPSCLHRSDKTT